ncbi:molybdopterin molybdotransferase MoeA [Allosalinactinospora lopnorensis]|uniref:molybdopterin molybdotransferase MoeA n=1 Tax=Allosalinactinospora lopnorensis TaxID=1352348 RepID=UPI000623C691|nr:molybdopterin molybdotransferase MoeA [Allosalinactinospora lopnorensis]
MVRNESAAVPWERAREAAREFGERCPRPAEQEVPLAAALGAALARDVTAPHGLPSYDSSAMDGYAVAGPGPWTVRGRALAGVSEPVVSLSPGQAVEVATGARVPAGAEAVLPYEAAAVDGGRVSGRIAPGRHVRRAGDDIPRGRTVLSRGTVVTPAVLGLAASLGCDSLPVRRPRVAAFITGDEIVSEGLLAPGAVRDAIGPMLPGTVAWAGAALEVSGHIGDSFPGMLTALRKTADRSDIDVIVVSGASSKGPADHLRGVLAELGSTVVVDGVACRPGHPQLLAYLGSPEAPGTVIVGLPGNPNAALAASVTLLVPVLSALAGRPDPGAASPRFLPLAGEPRPHHRDTRLVAVRVAAEAAEPVGRDQPGSLWGASGADAFAVVPPDWNGAAAALVWLPR